MLLLAFKPNYTIKPSESHDTSRLNLHYLWRAGINASTHDVPNTFDHSFDFPWRQILRIIIILISHHVYEDSDYVIQELNPFLLMLVNPKLKNADTFIFSILNVYLAYDKIGYDLPYVSRVIVGDKEKLV